MGGDTRSRWRCTDREKKCRNLKLTAVNVGMSPYKKEPMVGPISLITIEYHS